MREVILHHSLTKDGSVVDYTAIRNYHINTNGWRDIGYHYLLEKMPDGKPTILKGRMENETGAHTLGHNEAIGICIVGNYDITELPDDLYMLLVDLLDELNKNHNGIYVMGHNEYSDKSCPGKNFPLAILKSKYPRTRVETEILTKRELKDILLNITKGL